MVLQSRIRELQVEISDMEIKLKSHTSSMDFKNSEIEQL